MTEHAAPTIDCPKHDTQPLRILTAFPGVKPIVIPGCPKCGLEAAEAERQAEAEKDCRDMLERSRIPSDYHNCRVGTFPVGGANGDQKRMAVICAKYFVDNYERLRLTGENGSWMFFYGSVGTGKTGLACAVGMALRGPIRRLEDGDPPRRQVIYHTLSTLRRHIWDAKARGTSETAAVEELASCECLMVDEIGATTASDAERAAFFEVMDARYARRRPTILISNLEPSQIRDYESRLEDRLEQRAVKVPCKWPSLRRGPRSDTGARAA